MPNNIALIRAPETVPYTLSGERKKADAPPSPSVRVPISKDAITRQDIGEGAGMAGMYAVSQAAVAVPMVALAATPIGVFAASAAIGSMGLGGMHVLMKYKGNQDDLFQRAKAKKLD